MANGDGIVRDEGDARFSVHRLSWLAYVMPCVLVAALLPVSWAISHVSIKIAGVVLVLGVVWYIVQVLYLYSVEIFTDIDGIWIFRGIFPWARGVHGVKWRDVDEATYFPGLVSWATNSYRIRIAHRFTKASELVISHVRHGDQAVQFYNKLHQDIIKRLDAASGRP